MPLPIRKWWDNLHFLSVWKICNLCGFCLCNCCMAGLLEVNCQSKGLGSFWITDEIICMTIMRFTAFNKLVKLQCQCNETAGSYDGELSVKCSFNVIGELMQVWFCVVLFFLFYFSKWLNGFVPDDLEYEASDESLSLHGPQRCSFVCPLLTFWSPCGFRL